MCVTPRHFTCRVLPNMADNPKDITPKILLEHMQGMQQELLAGQAKLETKLTKRIDGVETKLTERIDTLETNLGGQIEAIDKRLDAVELEFLPKRVRRFAMLWPRSREKA